MAYHGKGMANKADWRRENSGSVRSQAVRVMLTSMLVGVLLVSVASVAVNVAQAEPPAGNWAMVLNEEFTTSGLNTAMWTPEWPSGAMSGECTAPNLVSQPGNGYLYLQVRAQASTCSGIKNPDTGALVESNPADGKAGHSGFLYSYGYVEWNVYVVGWGGEAQGCPKGGCIPDWPALWSFPENEENEIDTMEGLRREACHTWWHHVTPVEEIQGCQAGSYAGWHTYGADWEPGVLKFYYDGAQVGEVKSGYINSTPQYLIMNDVPPNGHGDQLVVPDEILVDYVRVWQHRPIVTTSAPTEKQPQQATLTGSVNANGLALTNCHFEYGISTSYGSSAECTGSESAESAIVRLSPGTTYHYRLVASNASGQTVGNDETVTTPGPVEAVTGTASSVLQTEAVLNGTVDPRGYDAKYYYEYGPTTSYGSSTSPGDAGAGSNPVSENAMVTRLTPGALYHFRLVATSGGITSRGKDKTFTTLVEANVFFPDASHSNTVTDRSFSPSTGWSQTNFGGDEVAKGSSLSDVMLDSSEPDVFFVDASKGDTLWNRWYNPTLGWLQANICGDEVAKGSSPTSVMFGGEANVFFVDASKGNTITDCSYSTAKGWTQTNLGGDEVAKGTSPYVVMLNSSEPDVFFVDASKGDTLTNRWYNPSLGWMQANLGGDEVAKGTSPTAVMVGNEANVFFVDATKGDTITDRWFHQTVGWEQTNLGGDEAAKGTSPTAVMVDSSEPNVFFVDAGKGNTITDRWYNPTLGWLQANLGGDEAASGTSPTAVMVGSEANVFFVDASKGNTITDRWYNPNGWQQTSLGGDEVTSGSSPNVLGV